jgi:8-oxo-dGTP pyrophosphatase MutT (NUDIX family)
MPKVIEKVTAFVTRPAVEGLELLLLEHPYAGIQIPAGTVEDETPEEAVLREVAEETGIDSATIRRYLGCDGGPLPEGQRIIAAPTKVYARPDATSFDWAHLRQGIQVAVNRRESGFSQVTYEEPDRVPDPQYVTMSITGWVPDGVLADTRMRYFYQLEYCGPSKDRWMAFADNHAFTLFWVPLSDLPDIIPPQDEWLAFLHRGLRGRTLRIRDGLKIFEALDRRAGAGR